MGCKSSKLDVIIPDYAEARPSSPVDDAGAPDNKVKVLLLGPASSGKSSILQQMQLCYGDKHTANELHNYSIIIRSNIVALVRQLCLLVRQEGYEERFAEESASADQAVGIPPSKRIITLFRWGSVIMLVMMLVMMLMIPMMMTI